MEQVHERLASDLPINSRVAVAIVDDPYSSVGEKLRVIRSIRNDPLAAMRSRGVIDEAMYLAGRKWQALHERSTIGFIGGIDPTKEAVDGGRLREPITDTQVKAFRELNEAHKMLGQIGSALMKSLLEESKTMAQIAEDHKLTTARQMNFLSLRIRECLEDLGRLWGFVG